MDIDNKDYEQSLIREFNMDSASKQETNNVYPAALNREPVKDLGKVKNPSGKLSMTREELENDPEMVKMKELTNYISLPVELMPSEGRFYSDGFRVYIRAARVAEIREYSMMDETNPSDIIDKLNFMLASCTKIQFDGMPGSYKDLLEHDRFYVIKRIQELTFKNGEVQINIPVPDTACKTPGCHPQTEVKFTSDMIERAPRDAKLEEYYDATNKCYSIRTKHYGVIQMFPPTIGVTTVVRDWAVKRAQNQKSWDQALAQMIPFFRKEWRQFKESNVLELATEFEGWDTTKYTLIYRLIEKMNKSIGMSQNIHVRCESCGGDIEIPVMFQDVSDDGQEVVGGFKSLFVQTISDRFDELC